MWVRRAAVLLQAEKKLKRYSDTIYEN